MDSEWILGRLAWGCRLDSTVSGQGPVAGCCECGDEPSGSCATELVTVWTVGSRQYCHRIFTRLYAICLLSRCQLLKPEKDIGKRR
jgi:hypothetical protein